MMNGMMMDGSMMFMMCFAMVFFILILVFIIGATIYVVTRQPMRKSKTIDRPLMILKERYVKGEINDEEYKQRRKVIEEKNKRNV